MPKNLLLADDSKTIQQAVSMTFAREDVKLTTVEDGEAALQAARASRPDLILADVSMPRLGGYELCQKIRADAGLKDVPVLLLGGGNPIDPAKAMAVGANGHMPKPFDSGKLIEQVKQILANPRAAAPRPAAAPMAPPRPAGAPVASRPPPPAAPKPAAAPGAAGSTMLMSRPPPPAAARPGISAPLGARPPPPAAARPAVPPAPAARPPAPPAARPPLTAAPAGAPRPAAPPAARPPAPGVPQARPSMPSVPPAAARPPAPALRPPAPATRPPPPAARPPPPPAVEMDEDIPMDEDELVEEVAKAPTQLRPVPAPPAVPKPSLSVVPQPAIKPAAHQPAGGGEAVLREALSKASREVIEKIAWEVVPELAETIIREELERLMKERGA